MIIPHMLLSNLTNNTNTTGYKNKFPRFLPSINIPEKSTAPGTVMCTTNKKKQAGLLASSYSQSRGEEYKEL